MNLIQPALLIVMLGALVFYLARLRTTLRDRLIAAALFAAGCGAVLFPAGTSWLARMLGVGRGADLVFYLAVVTGGFVSVLLYSRTMKLEELVTELTRSFALAHAEPPESGAVDEDIACDAPPPDRTDACHGDPQRPS